LHVKISPNLY